MKGEHTGTVYETGLLGVIAHMPEYFLKLRIAAPEDLSVRLHEGLKRAGKQYRECECAETYRGPVFLELL